MRLGAESFAWGFPSFYLEDYYQAPSVPMEELYMNMSYHLESDWDIYTSNFITKKGPNK